MLDPDPSIRDDRISEVSSQLDGTRGGARVHRLRAEKCGGRSACACKGHSIATSEKKEEGGGTHGRTSWCNAGLFVFYRFRHATWGACQRASHLRVGEQHGDHYIDRR